MTDEKDFRININLIRRYPKGFDIKTFSDGSIRLIKYNRCGKDQVNLSKSPYSWGHMDKYELTIEYEEKVLSEVIIIKRTSQNCYILIHQKENETVYQRLGSVPQIDEYFESLNSVQK